MTSEEHMRLLEIRKKSKSGQTLTGEEMSFCSVMHRLYPKKYREIDKQVIEWASEQMNPMYRRK